jgi:adenylosuccinate lyase
VLEKDPDIQANFDATELDRLFDPANYTGQAGAMVDKVLQSWGAHCARNGQGGA